MAFAVDPLYHQTSAQFDEGGAKGLLMNNLGVYGGCKILFDSLEVPGKCTSSDEQLEKSTTIDLSFAKGLFDWLSYFVYMHFYIIKLSYNKVLILFYLQNMLKRWY